MLFDTSTRYPRAIKARISVKSYLVLHASRTRGETILERIVILLNPFPLDVGARARNRASEKRRLSQNTLHVLRLGTLMHILMIIVLISRFIFRIAFFATTSSPPGVPERPPKQKKALEHEYKKTTMRSTHCMTQNIEISYIPSTTNHPHPTSEVRGWRSEVQGARSGSK